MVYNLKTPYLSSFVPPLVGDISRYNFRNSDQFQTLECKSQLYYNSFLPAVVREWNSLNESCRSSPSVDCFKNKLKQSTNVPKYYYSGPRKGQILHTRLRTNSSSLNHHLVSKNITDNDTSLCGHVEDTSHFLFDCPRFVNQRQVMMNRLLPISNPTLDLLLIGDSTLSYQVNVNIFSADRDYIIRTKRFVCLIINFMFLSTDN